MSMMIMAIGVVSLATLFPISVLHTIRAHQLTVATNHRYNAEAIIDAVPEIVHDPDYDGVPNFDSNYVVDPLGFAFGLPNPLQDQTTMLRHPGFPVMGNAEADLERADLLATLPDTWMSSYENVALTDPADPDPSRPSAIILPGFRNSGLWDGQNNQMISSIRQGFPRARVVCYYTNMLTGREELQWRQFDPDPTNPDRLLLRSPLRLPANAAVERADVEMQQRRFTWMLTVRNDFAGVAHVHVAVFFNRSFESVDEVVTPANFRIPDPTPSDPNRLDRTRVDITVDPAMPPFLKRGSYLLDAQNGHWYRIVDFTDPDANNVVTIRLATPIKDAVPNGRAAFFRGLLDVFSIAPQVPR